MSTPSVTILKNLVLNWKSNQMEEETIATFYRHWDGYPSCHAIDIANSLIVASRTKPEHIDFSGASVERGILNNRNWCQHFLKAMCMADARYRVHRGGQCALCELHLCCHGRLR